jgi:peptide/nickel transport system substrate-binding protein
MIKRSRFILVGAALLLLALVVVPAIAQQGEGGIIIDSTFGSTNADTVNPIFCLDTTCFRLLYILWPGLVGVDPETASVQPGVPGGLAESWDVSEDGLTYTFHLRDDITWSDGTPITSADYLYGWNAINDPEVLSDLSFLSAEYGGTIESVEAPDPYTVEVTFTAADCTAAATAGSVPTVPSHILPENYDELVGSDFNLEPAVSGGPFTVANYSQEQISLINNPLYPASDTVLGYVSPEGYIMKLVGDQTVQVQQFLAGEISFITDVPVAFREDVRAAAEAGDVQIYEYPGDSWDYIVLNYADPTNPQDGLDADGNPIDQGHHPLFGDVNVRQALAHAIDVEAIMEGAVFGEALRMPSSELAGSWAYNDQLDPITYDPELAAEMLAEAGWRDEDGDGVLEAHDALYAEDGTPFAFTLYTNEGNTRRAAIGQIVQDQLGDLGIQVDFQTADANVFFDEILAGQGFDAAIAGWGSGYPDDPDQTQLFATSSDTVYSGSNYASYSNPEVDEMFREALTVPGCAIEDRAAIYHDIQAQLLEDQVYIFLYSRTGMYAARSSVENFDPRPANWWWNMDAWSVDPS